MNQIQIIVQKFARVKNSIKRLHSRFDLAKEPENLKTAWYRLGNLCNREKNEEK